MRILLVTFTIASIAANAALLRLWQRDETLLHNVARARVEIYNDCRQMMADLKAQDPVTFTNVIVPAPVQARVETRKDWWKKIIPDSLKGGAKRL